MASSSQQQQQQQQQNNNNNNGDSSNRSNSDKIKQKEDLDLFLTTIESKLRGPFSSLDLSKAVTTSALRKTMTPPEYLDNLNQVLLRTDKVTQLRMLVGLLGLEPEQELDTKVLEVLNTAQEESEEPWVKVIAGLIQGIMFQTEDDPSRSSCRGAYAKDLLDKMAEDICERVLKTMRETKELNGGEYPPDLNAYYIPFKYSMVSDELRERAQIEPYGNPHFTANLDADILKVDEKLEAQRAKEAQEHALTQVLPGVKGGRSNSTSAAMASSLGRTNLPPGFKPANLVKKATAKSTSSMFLPRPNPAAARKAQLGGRAKLVRRKGGAQSLMKGTKYNARTAAAAGGGATTSTTAGGTIAKTTATPSAGTATAAVATASKSGGSTRLGATKGLAARAAAPRGRFASGKSKMKMLDVDAVSNLHQQTMERQKEQALSKMSKKRRIMEAAKLQGLKRSKPNNKQPTTTTTNTTTAPPAAATPQEQAQPEEPQTRTPTESSTRTPAEPATAAPEQQQQQQSQPEQEWKILLRERSNKLSDHDRSRVQQFFENNQFNPSPEQPVYKMKLHEQRSVDPTTGKSIKETFYLELDYENNTSKQSKKIKRY